MDFIGPCEVENCSGCKDATNIDGRPRRLSSSSSADSGISSLRSSPMRLQVPSVPVDAIDHLEGFERVFSKLRTPLGPWALFYHQDAELLMALRNEGFRPILESAKVRFVCSLCKSGWTSMRGKVQFLIKNEATVTQTGLHVGSVYYTPLGQRCDNCRRKGKEIEHGTYESPLWYIEEIEKVLSNVFGWISFLYYGAPKPVRFTERRLGKPARPHVKETCQACALNLCREGAWRQLQ